MSGLLMKKVSVYAEVGKRQQRTAATTALTAANCEHYAMNSEW
jgi:hypothetical protein